MGAPVISSKPYPRTEAQDLAGTTRFVADVSRRPALARAGVTKSGATFHLRAVLDGSSVTVTAEV